MEDDFSLVDAPIEENVNDELFNFVKQFREKGDTANEIVINALSMLKLLWEKNKKYGDAWKKFGIYSAINNVNEKAQRLVSMCWDEEKQDWRGSTADFLNDIEVEGSVYDTVKDLAGFALLAMSLFEHKREERFEDALKVREMI